MRAASVWCTRPALARWRFFLPLFEERRCRREAWERKILPVPVILNRFATAFLVLLRAMDFGMGGRKVRRFGEMATNLLGEEGGFKCKCKSMFKDTLARYAERGSRGVQEPFAWRVKMQR
jgi:hypothetical protein